MKARVITGLIAAFLLVALIYKGPFWLITLVILAIASMAYYEYDRLFFPAVSPVRLGRVMLYTAWTLYMLSKGLGMWAVSVWVVFIFHCVWHVIRANRAAALAESVREFRVEFFGFLYCTALFGFLLPILQLGDHGRDLLLLLFLIVSVGDTAAYFSGMLFGRHKLATQISPKKTVEGAVGGTLVSIGIAAWWVFFVYKGDPSPAFRAGIIGFSLVASVLAQFGDLFESLLKRSQAVKDSGGLLPGHGGILDRTDGLALAAPAFFLFFKYVLAGYL
jgi:phosphatidate cytidylyltransferase